MFIHQTVNGSNIRKLQSDLFNTNTRVLIPSIYTRLSQTHLSIPSKTKNNQSDMESPKGVWIKLNINGDQKETKEHESLETKMAQTLQEKWYKLSLDNGFSDLEKEGDSKLLTDFLNINLKKNL